MTQVPRFADATVLEARDGLEAAVHESLA